MATTAQRFEHCRLKGSEIEYLGRTGVFENREDRTRGSDQAWDRLEKEGWELVAVVVDSDDGKLIHYFKRPFVPQK